MSCPSKMSVFGSPDGDDDLHLLMLQSAFRLMASSPSELVVSGRDNKKVSFPRDVLVLFSPLVRSILSNLPCQASLSSPLLTLPDVSVITLLRIQDILTVGQCEESLSLIQTKELLDACELLGLDVRRLNVVQQKEKKESSAGPVKEVAVNLDSVTFRAEDIGEMIRERRKEGKTIILTTSSRRQSKPSPPPGLTKSNESLSSEAAMVVIKKENVAVSDAGESKESLEEKPEDNPETQETSQQTSPKKHVCEKCKKVHETSLLLKYHYCSHYMDILRKRFLSHDDSKKNACFICKKTYPNSRRLLLHIGVNHDKINDILRLKGFKQLTPVQERTEQSKRSDNGDSGAKAEKKTFDIRSMMDLKTVKPPGTDPGLNPERETSGGEDSKEKNSLDSECNFQLDCQVCKQRLGSFHMLEQHICRHFMKELTEQFSGIMEDMKCGLCNLAFKQKHSLLLHIGCKHGKINEILKQKGYVVLPAPIVNSNNGTLQKQMQNRLLEIKKERMDEDNLKAESSEEQSSTRAETSGAYNAFKLSEVLNKFSVPSI